MNVKINFHDLQTQYLLYKDEIDSAIQSILDSSHFIMGPAVGEFEQALANFLQCKQVISCASGTDALKLALLAIDLTPGDEVITSCFSFIAAAEIIALLGAKPVFVDIGADDYLIDSEKIEEKITAKTRAIIPVSLYGQPADMDPINQLANRYSEKFARRIYVIEDAAQSLGAVYKENKSGNLSDMGCLSFFPTKPLGCYGDGGAIVVNDNLLAAKIKSLRVHGQTKRYHHKLIGLNSRLDTLQAAILQVKLNHFVEEIKMRQEIASFYNQSLSHYDLKLPAVKSDRSSVYAQYSIRTAQRDQLIDFLMMKQIPTAVHYPLPLHLQGCFKYLGYGKGDFPIAEKTAHEIMSLPMSAFVNKEQQNYIIDSIAECFQNKSTSQVRYK